MDEEFGLGEATIEHIRQVFATHTEVESVILYGSRAKGNYKVGSDIDLTMKGKLSFSELLDITDALDELPLPYQFDLSVFENISNPDLLAHIERVGVEFYNKEKHANPAK